MTAVPGWIGQAREWVDAELARLLERERGRGAPRLLVDAMEHAVIAPGKRLRPALVRMFAEDLGGSTDDALPAAAAIELLHTYSLVHDDLPCMDDDDLRRGRPTVHVQFGEDLGVLVGDALQCLAFEVLAGAPRPDQSVAVLARAAGAAGMVGGQVLDLRSDQRAAALGGPEGAAALNSDEAAEVENVHALKTAALFAAACELGALAAGVDDERRQGAARFGRALGLCFQAVDDVLDVTEDAATLGKTPGKDSALERDSLVGILGLDGARREAARLAEEAERAARDLGFGADARGPALVQTVLARRA